MIEQPGVVTNGTSMAITVRLYLTFRTGRFRTETRECPVGVTAAAIARQLEIPDADIGLVLVNDRQAELERELSPGDTLSLFPLVGGG